MKTVYYFFFVLVMLFGLNCQAQKANSATFDFNEITFHSSPCNGSCPDISLNVSSDRTVRLIRIIYLKKGVEDTTRSGGFKGKLDPTNYNKLIALIKEINWETVHFSNITCCDRPIIQILITYNHEMRKFKSMEPPASTQKLIGFLTQLSTSIKIPQYNKSMDFDEISD